MTATVYTLSAPAGVFSFTGHAVTFTKGHVFQASAGVFSFNGNQASLTGPFHAAAGSFHFTGGSATLTVTRYGPIAVYIDPPDAPYVTVLTSVGPLAAST